MSYKSNKPIRYKNYFLCVARFVKKKNHLKLLEAFEIYKKNNGKFNLLLIGEGPEKNLIQNYIENSKFSDSIFIESWKQINELPNYYKNSNFVLLPRPINLNVSAGLRASPLASVSCFTSTSNISVN